MSKKTQSLQQTGPQSGQAQAASRTGSSSPGNSFYKQIMSNPGLLQQAHNHFQDFVKANEKAESAAAVSQTESRNAPSGPPSQSEEKASKKQEKSAKSTQKTGKSKAATQPAAGQSDKNGDGFPWISSIYTHKHKVHFDDTIDVWVDAIGKQGDVLNWEYEWSNGHQEVGKVSDNTTHLHVTLPVGESTAQPGDIIDFRATVTDSAGDTDTQYLQYEIEGDEVKTWDVWFDNEDLQTAQRVDLTPEVIEVQEERRNDPIVFDLDGDGLAGVSGNIEGNGQIDGNAVEFDIDPSRSSWAFVSSVDLPGQNAPAVQNGFVIYENGDRESIGPAGIWEPARDGDRFRHPRAKIFNSSSQWVAEWVRRDSDRFDLFWGNRQDKERTEWLKKGTGDGFLVWDHNNNGVIDDNTEMFSEFDQSGDEAFATGFQKLAHYFDKDNDGIVKGNELKGLKLWVDSNADAQTDTGELKELSEYGILQIVIPQGEELESSAVAGSKS